MHLFSGDSVLGLQFDGDDASEVELDGSLCVAEVSVSKSLDTTVAGGLGAVAAWWSAVVTAGCFLGKLTECFLDRGGSLNLPRNFVG